MSNIDSYIGVGVTWVQCNDSGIRNDTQTTVFVKHHTALNCSALHYIELYIHCDLLDTVLQNFVMTCRSFPGAYCGL